MSKKDIEKYAKKARRDFIASVTARARSIGLSDASINTVELSKTAIVNGIPLTQDQAKAYNELVVAIQNKGIKRVIDEVAYTWFNRFIAIRYMERHDWLRCGYAFLNSENESKLPEILGHIADLDEESFQNLDIQRMRELYIAGNREEELYRLLLIAQCNELSSSMPLLFERVSDASELLLPDNLLASNGLIRSLLESIPEEKWDHVGIIGYLYQYYISERKDEVIGKIVASEDIPAATQLFTPEWIAQYMVQNTLGHMWLATYPDSSISQEMPYYIEPVEQTEEVKAQRKAIQPKELDPEAITFLDPACGSGHILVEAYKVLKEIYTERGVSRRDIPRTILENNLFGIDIDPRASQLTQLSLLMIAKEDDRLILDNPPKMNIVSMQASANLLKKMKDVVDAAEILRSMSPQTVVPQKLQQLSLLEQKTPIKQGVLPTENAFSLEDVIALVELFKDADTFGSLLRVPAKLKKTLPRIRKAVDLAENRSESAKRAAALINPFLRQAEILAKQYDCVVANPPYMGRKGMNDKLKRFLQSNYKDVKSDLFSAFIIRDFELSRLGGQLGFMSPFVWMFISSYEKLRIFVLKKKSITSLVQLEYSGFDGATVPICTYTFENIQQSKYKGSYIRLSDFRGADNQAPKTREAITNRNCGWFYTATAEDFAKIPSSPIAYWVSEKVRRIFMENGSFGDVADAHKGLATADNNRFLRLWFEVSFNRIGFGIKSREEAKTSGLKWFPYNKGGEFRKWYGNQDYLVNWENDGEEIYNFEDEDGKLLSVPRNSNYYFRECISWSNITSSKISFRFYESGFIHDQSGLCIFSINNEKNFKKDISFLNLNFIDCISKLLNSTLNFNVGNLNQIPYVPHIFSPEKNINISQKDLTSYETSWNFELIPLLAPKNRKNTLAASYASACMEWHSMTDEMRRLEEENNRIFNEAHDLQDEIPSEVPLKEITLTCNPWYRYGEDEGVYRAQGEDILVAKTKELEARLCSDSIKELISYALGCMMGRYSLDQPGLVYAEEGGKNFNPELYKTFPVDDDGIVPMLDLFCFEDDFAHRFTEFVKTLWGTDALEENLKFVADQLDSKLGEVPEATIRRWLSTKFYKECHLKMYRNRPIYWLFSSGKQKAFEALVYLHRIGPNTIARMRTQYVATLAKIFVAEIARLDAGMESLTGAAARKAEKERESFRKKQVELREFDDKLRHYEDLNITLNLDDGVRVNYGKFRDILAEAKAVTKE